MMDFGALSPEINSTRMYAGPGALSLTAAAMSWDNLASDLQAASGGYRSIIAGLVTGRWLGPTSMTMATAFGPYAAWMAGLAGRAAETAGQARLAAEVYEAAFVMTVPPPAVFGNRTQLATLIATNFLGQNAAAIAANEAEYAEMWAQDAAAMYAYAAGSAEAATLTGYTDAPQITDVNAAQNQSNAVTKATGASGVDKAALSNLVQQVPATLATMSVAGTTTTTGTSTATSALASSLVSSLPSSIPSYLMAAGTPLYGMSSILGMAQSAQGMASSAASGIASAAGSAASAGSGALGSLGRLGGVAAALGNAASLGPMAVPVGWSSVIPNALPSITSALPATLTTSHMPSMMGGLPMTGGSSGRPPVAPRYGIVPTVMTRPPSAGYG
jgi:PPE-repeat protein